MKLPIYREFVGQRSMLHSTSSYNQPKPDGGKLYRKLPPPLSSTTHTQIPFKREKKKKRMRERNYTLNIATSIIYGLYFNPDSEKVNS